MKLKLFFLAYLLILLNGYTFAQITEIESKLRSRSADTTKGWKSGGIVSINLSLTSLTNWAAGGQNSFSVNGFYSLFMNYKNNNISLDNMLDIGYGILKQGQDSDYRKTDDRFDFLSKYGRQAFNNFYISGLFNFKTQMTIGKDYSKDKAKISNFLSPAYLIGALGMDFKPNNYVSTFFAPLTGKITIVKDQDLANAGAFGVEKAVYDNTGKIIREGRNTKREFGGYARLIYTRNNFESELLKNISITSKIDFFSNYIHKPQNIDISWETLITLRVNKYIAININSHLVYDDDVLVAIDKNNDGIVERYGPRVQFKQIIGLGFSYKY